MSARHYCRDEGEESARHPGSKNSVQQQTLETLEHIIVDNCSIDGILETRDSFNHSHSHQLGEREGVITELGQR
jgi:hypothetical protein